MDGAFLHAFQHAALRVGRLDDDPRQQRHACRCESFSRTCICTPNYVPDRLLSEWTRADQSTRWKYVRHEYIQCT